MKTAVIVSGAGAMGWFEAAALKALHDSKIDYQFIVGTSSGGLNAAMFHAGQIDALIELWMTIKDRDVFVFNPLEAFGHAGCLLENYPLKNLIARSVNLKALRANPVPLVVNVTNLLTSQLERLDLSTLNDEQALEALLQTAAIPVLFPEVNGKCDGGILADIPIGEVLLDDVDRILLFSGLYPAEKVKLGNIIEVAIAAINTMLLSSLVNGMQAVAAMNQLRATPIELVMFQPQKDYDIGMINFNKLGSRDNRKKLIDEAYQQTMDQLKSLTT